MRFRGLAMRRAAEDAPVSGRRAALAGALWAILMFAFFHWVVHRGESGAETAGEAAVWAAGGIFFAIVWRRIVNKKLAKRQAQQRLG